MSNKTFSIREQTVKVGPLELHFQSGSRTCALVVRGVGDGDASEMYVLVFENEGEIMRVQKIKPLDPVVGST